MVSLPQHIAKHFREVHTGGNWTWSNLQENLEDLSYVEATTKIKSLHSIATLTYHVNYFVCAALKVLEGGVLDAHDQYSFDLPPINTNEDWQEFKIKVLADAERFAFAIEQLPVKMLWETFSQEKYGNYYRNILGIIEHTHYHLGQIVIIKKLIRENYS